MNLSIPKYLRVEGEISKKMDIAISILGLILLILIWHLVTLFGLITPTILPSPYDVFHSYGDLYRSDHLAANTWFSIKLNLFGYLEAILISIPVGFAMGLVPAIRSLISRYFDAFRFLPLPAITGIFAALFGIDLSMKVHFLSFGIMLYLIPVIVQRIDEIEIIHKQTITTLGASKWQKIKHLYLPYTMSKISDDIRVLVAISWTYIVIVELLNKEGGLGAMIYQAARQSQTAPIYAIVLEIIALGYIQDLLLKQADKAAFPYKHSGQIKKTLWERIKSLKSLITKEKNYELV